MLILIVSTLFLLREIQSSLFHLLHYSFPDSLVSKYQGPFILAMVDGVQTRSQQEVSKLQSDFKELEKRLEDKIERTITDKV